MRKRRGQRGVNGTAGGLAGLNSGTITNAFATGNVTGAAGTRGVTTLGGLVGANESGTDTGQGMISNSFARGNVGGANVANLQAGGLVGGNSGTIQSSVALGNVRAGDGSTAGGLVASNFVSSSTCAGCANDTAIIAGSGARGSVTVGDASIAGGLVGTGDGTILSSSAIGTVTGGGNSVLGGVIGTLIFGNGPGEVIASSASGTVTSIGANSTVGGFVGVSGGTIFIFDRLRFGDRHHRELSRRICRSKHWHDRTVTRQRFCDGLGNRDVIGGFVGANFGSIDASAATGNAPAQPIARSGLSPGPTLRSSTSPSESVSGSSFPVGTITNSIATGAANGGTGSTVDPFIALVDPTTAVNPPAFPSTIAGCTNPTCVFVATGVLPSSPISPVTPLTPPVLTPPVLPELLSTSPPSMPSAPPALLLLTPELLTSLAAQQAQVIQNLTGVVQLAALSTPPVVSNIQGAIKTPVQPPAGASAPAPLPADGNPARPRAQGRGYSAGHRDPPDPGRGGGADRQQITPTSCRPPFDGSD